MKGKIGSLILSLLIVVSVPFVSKGQSVPTLQRQVVLENLNSPWDIAFAPDGAMFFTLRGGKLRVRLPNGTVNELLSSIPDLNAATQSGLLGIALDPQFVTNRHLYAFQSSNLSGAMDNRIRKYRVNDDYTAVENLGDILTGISWGDGGGHSGGRIRFGNDGALYITTGDNRSATLPQDKTRLGGKVLRVTPAGSPAMGNPIFGGSARPEIFAFGFRNPQGLAIEPESERVFTCEHGPQTRDEVTWIRNGGNGGWDPNDGAGNYIGYTGTNGSPMTDLIKFPSAMLPAYINADSAGMSGCTFVKGLEWGEWNGALIVGFLSGQSARVVQIGSNGESSTAPNGSSNYPEILQGNGRLRALVQGPDGALYVATDGSDGKILKFVPTGVVVPTPVPTATPTPTPVVTATPTPIFTLPPATPTPTLTPTPIPKACSFQYMATRTRNDSIIIESLFKGRGFSESPTFNLEVGGDKKIINTWFGEAKALSAGFYQITPDAQAFGAMDTGVPINFVIGKTLTGLKAQVDGIVCQMERVFKSPSPFREEILRLNPTRKIARLALNEDLRVGDCVLKVKANSLTRLGSETLISQRIITRSSAPYLLRRGNLTEILSNSNVSAMISCINDKKLRLYKVRITRL
jgi:glucose/arabinose dehydrogenase